MASPLDRRSFLLAGAGAIVLAACSDDKGQVKASPSSGQRPDWNLVGFYAPDPLLPGTPQRLAFGLADKDGVVVKTSPVPELAFTVTVDGQPLGEPVTVSDHHAGLERPYFPLMFTPPKAGVYTITSTVEGTKVETTVQIETTSKTKQPGQPMVPLDTPTTADRRGVDLLCTRMPACPLHDVTLREALAKASPVAFVIATPQFCQTAICGPVLDVVLAARADFPGITFLHSEVYPTVAAAQPDVQQTVEAIGAYGLTYEPVLFLARADGMIERRIDVIFDAVELRDGLALLAG